MAKVLFRAITPQRKFNYRYFKEEFADELKKEVVPDLKEDFKDTVDGWTNKPSFGSRVTIQPDSISVFIFAQGEHKEQYKLVTLGSKPHTIRPRNKTALRFKSGYTPSTSPRRLKGRAKRRFGNTVTTQLVNHPGFEARRFPERIAEDYFPDFRRRAENALRRAARRQ